ncbi:glycerophosphodiester phosphodiesterase family protein [Neoactinobaculum massilliense]|uniref:glycerophosphodiester phosphodiesterase family protein n=1 Tax=Neoactinobaculum massilliense TaxID=2364794 RepID=UPI000F54B79E|nr:glycerophosphodiester phosphodiesterase family protein [Neoactinobaculum massilliense]
MRYYAHRGNSAHAPENTIAAFESAQRAGFEWLETDIDVTSDGQIRVLHDSHLDRTTNGSGLITEMAAAEVDRLDAGSWFGPEFAGQRIPTLEEFLDFIEQSGLSVNIEIKPTPGGANAARILMKAAVAAFERFPGRILISSFNHVILSELRHLSAGIPVAPLYPEGALPEGWLAVAQLMGATAIHLGDGTPESGRALTKKDIAEVRELGFDASVYTITTPERALELESWGATGVFTNGEFGSNAH